MNHYDVIIVGASFAGLACGRRLAENGQSVLILERKKDLSRGIHTTGIIVKEAADAFDLPADQVKAIENVRLYAPSLSHIDLQSSDYFFLATDTGAVLKTLAQRAEDAGVEIRLNTPYKFAIEDGGRIILPEYDVSCEYLIGADGPESNVAKDWELGQNQKFLLGAEAEFSTADIPDPKAFYCFLNQQLAYGYLGWVVPGVDVIQVGVATALPEKPDIQGFIDHVRPLFNLDDENIVARRGGLIPVGGPVAPLSKGNVILLGDAAGTVSPFSAGGIHTADYYGCNLADQILAFKNGQGDHPSQYVRKHYPKFRIKALKRWVFEKFAPDWLLNLVIQSFLFRMLAKIVFFKEKRLT